MNPVIRNFKITLIAMLVWVAMAPTCFAIDGVAFEFGTVEGDENAERYGIALKWDWSAQWFSDGDWYLGGFWEAGASYWDGDKGRFGNDSLGDFNFTPVFRFQRKPNVSIIPFLEFGVGAHVHTDDSIGNKNFDIPFAFGTHVGAGIRFGERGKYELLYRFQHLSNADLGDDNPGINFHVVQLGYRF